MKAFTLVILLLTLFSVSQNAHLQQKKDTDQPGKVVVLMKSRERAVSFLPSKAFGAGVDGHGRGEVAQLFSQSHIQSMLGAGLQRISYRLRSELAVQAWHWNPRGTWSNQSRQEGYWTSNQDSALPILVSYGYRLPRRGNTFDQDYNDGYSRLDDGDGDTFWKSNPYLDEYFTHEPQGAHPQWVVVDLKTPRKVNALQILWGTPYATQFSIQYSNQWHLGESTRQSGVWTDFPKGAVTAGTGTAKLLQLSLQPTEARFVRISMIRSSGTCTGVASDIRNCLGYAIRELYIGFFRNKRFRDFIHHSKSNRQTVIYVSSTDPWHRKIDRDPNLEQPGLDLIFQSVLTRNLPVLIAVPVIYDTPENAAAELAFLQKRGYQLDGIELGEEPDGQYIESIDYGALYVQWYAAIRRVDARTRIGGPSLSGLDGNTQLWISTFLDFLVAQHHLQNYQFFSFEWYPVETSCSSVDTRLAQSIRKFEKAMERFQENSLLRRIPWVMAEYGYSANGGAVQAGLTSALFNSETVVRFLLRGGQASYLYGYEPSIVSADLSCHSGNQMILQAQKNNTLSPLTSFHAARLITTQWAQPLERPHYLYEAISDVITPGGDQIVSAYGVRRPDQQVAILFVNHDAENSWPIKLTFQDVDTGKIEYIRGAADLYQLSGEQYARHENGSRVHPDRSNSPKHLSREIVNGCCLTLSPYSVSVLRGYLVE